MIVGLIVGILLAFFMKRSRLCFAGTLRDIYMEKKPKNFYFILIVFSLQGFIYYLLVIFNVLNAPKDKAFSLLATILGALIFGIGAVLANGCSVSMLIKAGDGRVNGLVALITFFIIVVSSKEGLLKLPVKYLQSKLVITDNIASKLPFSPFWIFLVLALFSLYIVYNSLKNTKKPKYSLKNEYSGIKHILIEKNWNKHLACLLIGIIAGVSFLLIHIAGAKGGWGITTPIYSWSNALINGKIKIGWKSLFVLGILVGGFITAIISKEFSIKVGNAKSVVLQIVGGAFMAFGAVLAQGCLVGFGMTGVAMFSLQGIIGLISIIIGLWIGAKIVYNPSKLS